MSRTSAPFWKSARRNVDDLPECPSSLSEPAYANLMFFPHCHDCRIRAERRAALYSRFDQLSVFIEDYYRPRGTLGDTSWDALPVAADFALMPQYRTILDAPNAPNPTWDSVEAINAGLSEAIVDWTDARKQAQADAVGEALPELADVQDPLTLAAVGFTCTRCSSRDARNMARIPMRFSAVLGHVCTRAALPLEDEDFYAAAVTDWANVAPHSLEHIVIDHTTTQQLHAILEALHLDPLTVMYEDLDHCLDRLLCVRCFNRRSGQDRPTFPVKAFDWVRAVRPHALPLP
ncbi:hypothetical protein C8Q79DRAFT_1009145 [Trametes meyenii]|nr:hypothetical protein C8Q79DRAFT_1009145 [Trametes meyenii]